MTTFASAVKTLETVSGLSSDVKQITYIAMVAKRKVDALVASRTNDHKGVMHSLKFAIANENSDLAWATMGSVEYWESEAEKSFILKRKAEAKRNTIMESYNMVMAVTA